MTSAQSSPTTVEDLATSLNVPPHSVMRTVTDLCKAHGPQAIVAEARGMRTSILTTAGVELVSARLTGAAA